MGDEARLKQLFSILFDNAAKFSPPGTAVQLVVVCRDRELEARIVDQGQGIPEAELPRIFDRFYRGAGARANEGSGLGLAIAQVIVERHGGRLVVRSEVGRGTEFTVLLPLSSPAQPAPDAGSNAENPELK
jgi:signal transduction histidine kinase